MTNNFKMGISVRFLFYSFRPNLATIIHKIFETSILSMPPKKVIENSGSGSSEQSFRHVNSYFKKQATH